MRTAPTSTRLQLQATTGSEVETGGTGTNLEPRLPTE
jgi:hypothetical protein